MRWKKKISPSNEAFDVIFYPPGDGVNSNEDDDETSCFSNLPRSLQDDWPNHEDVITGAQIIRIKILLFLKRSMKWFFSFAFYAKRCYSTKWQMKKKNSQIFIEQIVFEECLINKCFFYWRNNIILYFGSQVQGC